MQAARSTGRAVFSVAIAQSVSTSVTSAVWLFATKCSAQDESDASRRNGLSPGAPPVSRLHYGASVDSGRGLTRWAS
jgi:hypothetical protein